MACNTPSGTTYGGSAHRDQQAATIADIDAAAIDDGFPPHRHPRVINDIHLPPSGPGRGINGGEIPTVGNGIHDPIRNAGRGTDGIATDRANLCLPSYRADWSGKEHT
jgi:hypothetical protein